jgi:hypothetical protein
MTTDIPTLTPATSSLSGGLLALIATIAKRTDRRVVDCFTATMRTPNLHEARARAVGRFCFFSCVTFVRRIMHSVQGGHLTVERSDDQTVSFVSGGCVLLDECSSRGTGSAGPIA